MARLSNLYRKAPYFKDYYPTLKDALTQHHPCLANLNIHLIKTIANMLGAKIEVTRSSKLPHLDQDKNSKLIEFCKFTGADTYLCGSGGRSYVDAARFQKEGVKLLWHSYHHPVYRQVYDGFQPNMSIIDLLFNMGPQAKEVLLSGGKIEESNQALSQTALA